MKVLLVIPVLDRPKEISKLLKSLNILNLDGIDLNVSIVDDGSSTSIEHQIKIPKDNNWKLNIYKNNSPKGPGYCRNLVSKTNKCDYLWYLDSDTEVFQSECLTHMISILQSEKNVGGVGGTLEPYLNEKKIIVWHKLYNFLVFPKVYNYEKFSRKSVKQIATSNLLIRKNDFDSTNGFRIDLSRDEDHELCLAIQKLGFQFLQDKKMVVWHYLSSVGRNKGHFSYFNDKKQYYNSLLKTRIDLMSHYAKKRLVILPLLDAVTIIIIIKEILVGNFPKSRLERLNQSKKLDIFSSLKTLLIVIIEVTKCYFYGYSVLLRDLFK